jgi:peroxiredoxin
LFTPLGEPIPDLELQTPQGEVKRLSELQRGPTLLIFLRHLA